jgi:hypothetical protein
MVKREDWMKILALAVAGAVLVYFYYKHEQSEKKESLDNIPQGQYEEPAGFPSPADVSPSQQQQIDQVVSEKDQLQAHELLPKYNDASEFAKQNPVSNLLKEQNFLISGYHVGVNTVMQSNKIPYHDIRAAPPIPKESVGPWSQSSYDNPAGSSLRGLEFVN